MSGYKRVNFYELCRLCASNQDKKIYIFKEEGLKLQLQTKIQSCLSLLVSEDDCLPKVVCYECFHQLEECYTFKNGCKASEKMLSSYFTNYKHTADFIHSGQVYIKDKPFEFVGVQMKATDARNETIKKDKDNEKPINSIVLPVTQDISNSSLIKNVNVSVNPNGEVINISPAVDMGILQVPKIEKRKEAKRVGEKVLSKTWDEKSLTIGKIVVLNPITLGSNQNFAITIPNNENQPNSNNWDESNLGNSECIISNMNPIPSATSNIAPIDIDVIMTNQAGSDDKQEPTAEVNVKREVASELTNESVQRTFTCEICSKFFKRREHLYQHVKLHIGYRPYVCQCCNKSFIRKEHLHRHMMSHSGQRNFCCNSCGKSFSRNDNLLKHKKTHERNKVYTCEVCSKQFIVEHYYRSHKATHENNDGSWS